MFKTITTIIMAMAIAFSMSVNAWATEEPDVSDDDPRHDIINRTELLKDWLDTTIPADAVLVDTGASSTPAREKNVDTDEIFLRKEVNASTTTPAAQMRFADEADINDACKAAVDKVSANGIMVGNDKNFDPNGIVTRAQMAKILCKTIKGAKLEPGYIGESKFTDVAEDAWYYAYVNVGASYGWFQGYNGLFLPDAELTIPAAAKMLLTALGYDAETYGFVGMNWENNVLSVAEAIGLLDGVDTDLNGPASRQWVAKMVADIAIAK